MFILKSIAFVIIIVLAQGSYGCPAGSMPAQETLKVAEQLFGPSVQGHPCLFEINNEYALRIDLAKSGDVTKLEVSPKYFFQELVPEWTEPDHLVGLSNNDYVDLLFKVTQLKSVGTVIAEGNVGAVTNSKLWLWDEYQNAFIQRRLIRTAQDVSKTHDTMHSFSVYYIRGVKGLVDEKQTTDEFGRGQRFRIKIDGCSYLTSKAEFAKVKKGEHGVIYAAGPLDNIDCSQLRETSQRW